MNKSSAFKRSDLKIKTTFLKFGRLTNKGLFRKVFNPFVAMDNCVKDGLNYR
ncbi:hypothetical protein LEP1GSC062_3187 [Leptospira alexanderi serovar Manhao 3 str. L 60]|uniref:Uncharacterized protein n=1 Tax=Leptospira alexanderi serovar Manhao 3 str. L 60 TaxID=1049759 RepID=V6HVP5_9LEPT|nr:hypothetical protein LEP1GSC062_3187 [Leptospira alexanderi serovar Manhao 3 str. L 60]